MPHEMMQNMKMEDMDMPELLDKAIQYHQEHMTNPKSATPESQQVLMDMLVQIKTGMAGMMGEEDVDEKSPMDETRMPMKPDGGESDNPYSGGNRKYSYAQYRPGK